MIYLFSIIGFFCSTMNGYDASLINNLLQNKWFQEYYGVEKDGIWAGIVSSMYQIGGVVALPFVGPIIDGLGRRVGMASGALIVVIGTIIQGTSHSSSQFMGGRFMLGFGVSLSASAGPMYVVELNHPAYRGVVGGTFSCRLQHLSIWVLTCFYSHLQLSLAWWRYSLCRSCPRWPQHRRRLLLASHHLAAVPLLWSRPPLHAIPSRIPSLAVRPW